ncbi:MAG: NAD(P)/FAD-dependent oxidoreductase, partial [Planctomycetota bacterium]
PYAPGMKTIADATAMRRRIFEAFETAERKAHDDHDRPAWLNFVVVGGGPTGVELAGALGEITHHTLRGNFRAINPADSRILLVEVADRLLTSYPESLSAHAKRDLERLGVTVRTHTRVTDITRDGVTLSGDAGEEFVPTRTVLWAAGVRASSLGAVLARSAGAELDKAGRVVVRPDMAVSDAQRDIFVIGDLAAHANPDGKFTPGVAQGAMQAGSHVARLIRQRVRSGNPTLPGKPFRYKDKGSMATIGRSKAVADLHWIKLTGWFGWMAWLMLHLIYLVEFQSRILVLTQWAWNYWTWNRGARLITGEDQRGGTRILRKPESDDPPAAP